MDTQSMVRMLILIPRLIFSISNPKSIFRQILAEKVKIWFYDFISPRSLTLLQFGALCTLCCVYVFWVCNIIGKRSKLFVLPENWQSMSRIMILIPTLVLCISSPKCIFGEIWPEKVKAICFSWKLAHRHTHAHTHTHTHTQREKERVSRGCWFLSWD